MPRTEKIENKIRIKKNRFIKALYLRTPPFDNSIVEILVKSPFSSIFDIVSITGVIYAF